MKKIDYRTINFEKFKSYHQTYMSMFGYSEWRSSYKLKTPKNPSKSKNKVVMSTKESDAILILDYYASDIKEDDMELRDDALHEVIELVMINMPSNRHTHFVIQRIINVVLKLSS